MGADSGNAIIFRAKAKFFGQSQQPKMKKKYLFFGIYLTKNGIHFV